MFAKIDIAWMLGLEQTDGAFGAMEADMTAGMEAESCEAQAAFSLQVPILIIHENQMMLMLMIEEFELSSIAAVDMAAAAHEHTKGHGYMEEIHDHLDHLVVGDCCS